jgi:hypothetical protein
MAESKLDQIVKGAPAPTVQAPSPSLSPPQAPSDPLSTLPSSPPQIYLNLLILEASLRSQYLTLRARRRQHTFFLFLLAAWIACFFYALFLRPREDGRGVGGSVYWVVETGEKVALMGGVVTGILVWGTGQWERGIRWPRRWVGIANRGLRGINSKLVVIKGPWWRELFSTLSIVFPYSSFFRSQGSSYHYVSHLQDLPKRSTSNHLRGIPSPSHSSHLSVAHEEDLAPGGDYVKLLLLPKPFSPAFRENWEAFRSDYWENENERRAQLLHKLRQKERELAKREGGWLWWTGWRGWKRANPIRGSSSDVEKSHHQHRTHLDSKTSRPSSMYRSGSQSRTSSRSTTPTYELDEKPLGDRHRRSSTASNSSSKTSSHYDKDHHQQQLQQQQQHNQQQQQLQPRSSKRRSKIAGSSSTRGGSDKTSSRPRDRSSNRGGERVARMTPAETSRPITPDDAPFPPSIRRESSMQSLSSGNESDRSGTSSVWEDSRPAGRTSGVIRERGSKGHG